MAKLTKKSEPYVHIKEKVVESTIQATAGEELVVGCPIVSDCGDLNGVIIRSQRDFLDNFASQDITKAYIDSLDNFYSGASQMWLNAYRLAGSVNLFVVRAAKQGVGTFAKALNANDTSNYIIKDGEILKSVGVFKFVPLNDQAVGEGESGWAISINGVGVFGNLTTNNGAQYDFRVDNLGELVEKLNDCPNFFSPSYTFYKDVKGTDTQKTTDPKLAKCVRFDEVYLGKDVLDKTDTRIGSTGMSHIVAATRDYEESKPQSIIDLNSEAYSHFEEPKAYATNKFNSNTDLKVRIRRFNHNAVEPITVTGSNSPWKVITNLLPDPEDYDIYDFYEFAITDPSISSDTLLFNVGNISAKGDMTIDEVNSSIKMIELSVNDLEDLNLDYYEGNDNSVEGWVLVVNPSDTQKTSSLSHKFSSKSELDQHVPGETESWPESEVYARVGYYAPKYYSWNGTTWVSTTDTTVTYKIPFVVEGTEARVIEVINTYAPNPQSGQIAQVGDLIEGNVYQYQDVPVPTEISKDLTIPSSSAILKVSDDDILKALDKISLNEVYTVEGLCDLGNTVLSIQNYMANMANNSDENYFYPISTLDSTNYLTIANGASKLSSHDSYKLYLSAPWDQDSATVGWRFNTSPSVLYWETVGRNRALSKEFAPMLGQSNGVALYQKPKAEFNKNTRELLLSAHVNTVKWNVTTSAWNWNDNYTQMKEDTIMSDEANSRLMIRISKSIDLLMKPFIGRRINAQLWSDAYSVIDNWFRSYFGPMTYGIDDYRITIDESNNTKDIIRANKMKVLVEVKYQRALKYIEVTNKAYDVNIDFNGQE